MGLGITVLTESPVRRILSRVVPLKPNSFVHAVALVLVLAMVLVPPVPLVVNGTPPFLSEALLGGDEPAESPGDFARSEALTTFGRIGIKVWVYKGDVYNVEPPKPASEPNKEVYVSP